MSASKGEELALIDGRWCAAPGCGGQAEYKRVCRGPHLITVIWCWSCGRRVEVNRVLANPPEPSMRETPETPI